MSDPVPTPREAVFRAAGKPLDDPNFADALNVYRERLLAAWQEGSLDPAYCPYDCDGCHDEELCPCPNCVGTRKEYGS